MRQNTLSLDKIDFDVIRRGKAIVQPDRSIGIYYEESVDSYIAGADLFVGSISEDGSTFYPSDEVYAPLEPWLREQEREFIEEREEEGFGLYVPKEYEMRFAYGPNWREIWDYDDETFAWRRR